MPKGRIVSIAPYSASIRKIRKDNYIVKRNHYIGRKKLIGTMKHRHLTKNYRMCIGNMSFDRKKTINVHTKKLNTRALGNYIDTIKRKIVGEG